MLRQLVTAGMVLMLVVVAGCGESDSGGADKTSAKPGKAGRVTNSNAKSYDKNAKGVVKGVVSFEGAHEREALELGGDKYCKGKHSDAPLLSEDLVVNDGKLQNAVVYFSKGAENFKDYPVPSTPAVLDQVCCQYVPHVLAAMLEQKVVARNSDDTVHNIHVTGANGDHNMTQYKKGLENEIPQSKLGVDFINVGCDVHKWMKAKLAIFDHPFFCVTNEKGEFEIKGVPDGEYEVGVWHESVKLAKIETVKIKIEKGAVVSQNFTAKKK
jgi:hypothetical protein